MNNYSERNTERKGLTEGQKRRTIIRSSVKPTRFSFTRRIPFLAILIAVILSLNYLVVSAQTNYFTQGTQSTGNVKSSLFRQEIARFEITVVREGKAPLSITQVPRVQQGDILKVRLLDEPVNGIKIDQSNWDWTFLVTFINPNRRVTERRDGKAIIDKSSTVSEEIQFRKRGWYKQYSFTVPYDSQPVFFLYPSPKYRDQLVKVVNSKYEELRKLGDKTIEIAGAYAQISTFLNELQIVLNRNALTYGYTANGTNSTNVVNPYNPYNPYDPYNPYGTTPTPPANQNVPVFGLPAVPMMNQMVEGLARSFNIGLPACWNSNSNAYGSSYGSGNGTYDNNNYGDYRANNNSSSYLSGYSSYGTNPYGANANATADFVSRAQCVAKNVNLGDFDFSIMKMWQQGGVFLAAELQKKYPELAFYINIAAAAIDFIVRAFQKSPLRIVPSLVQSSDNQSAYGGQSTGMYGNNYANPYGAAPVSTNPNVPQAVKISLFAESQPSEGQYVTVYPIVVHKWQSNPDPEVISLYPPILAEPCLHTGLNILKNTDLSESWSEDTYSRDFKLVISSSNDFRKEFPLKKNVGAGGWELNVTPNDLNQIPKVNMRIDAELVGNRGFNEIKSPRFELPIPIGGAWEVTPESQRAFAVGGKRRVTLRNSLGGCRCLQRVIFKPSTGGQFVFDAAQTAGNPNSLLFSIDGKEVSFVIDTSAFLAGVAKIELKTYGDAPQQQIGQLGQPAESNDLKIQLYPAPPVINDVQARRGDREILVTGERLDQIRSININGRRALPRESSTRPPAAVVTSSVPTSGGAIDPSVKGWTGGANSAQKEKPSIAVAVLSPSFGSTQTPSQYRYVGPNQRLFVLEDRSSRIIDTISLDLELNDEHSYQYPDKFLVGVSRPAVKANEVNEIEGVFAKSNPVGNVTEANLASYPVASIDTSIMTVAVQNTLTDYDFKNENLSIETGIENAEITPEELPKVSFNVLDGDNLRLDFTFTDRTNKNLGGRRLQFRIRDKVRGDSDWYTIKQTFIRIPRIESIVCAKEMENRCELTGDGVDHIGQISVDSGVTWAAVDPAAQKARATADGKITVMIPLVTNKKLVQIRLRDFPNTAGLSVPDFLFQGPVLGRPGKKSGVK